jgi:glycerophosphoryl diester phosphodiesterase
MRAMPASTPTPVTFAHRGARADRPENTIDAFRFALEHGARGLETDAWLAADGEVVLVHDEWIWSRRRGVPARLRVPATSSERLAAANVPRLRDLYAALGSDFEVSIDLEDDQVGEHILVEAATKGVLERLWLCSASVPELERLRALAPAVRLVHSQSRSRLPEAVERHAADLARAGVDAMNLHQSEWTGGLVALFHRFDVRAFAWDAQEVRQLRKVLDMGVDAVYCDHVDRMVATVAEWESAPKAD